MGGSRLVSWVGPGWSHGRVQVGLMGGSRVGRTEGSCVLEPSGGSRGGPRADPEWIPGVGPGLDLVRALTGESHSGCGTAVAF